MMALAAAALLATLLAEPPVVGDCARDPDTLIAQAAELLGPSPEPAASDLSRARQLLRAARRARRSAALDLFAADLAFAAGDAEEGGDLLASAAEADPKAPLSAGELYLLARRSEERRRWREAMFRYDALRRKLAAEGEPATWVWIAPRIRELELEVRAAAIAVPPSGLPVPPEARLALADARRALARGELPDARAKLQIALRLAPGYAEALLALSAVETRAGRPAEAIRAAREALAAEPDRVATLSSLANLLWAEPDRRAKEEALALTDRAAALRPEEPALLRVAAERYAELGDAPRALERLERYLARAPARERAEVAALRDALSRRVAAGAEPGTPGAAAPEEIASEAVDRWRKAQVLAGYGDFESLAAALELLAEAEKLDASFAQVPELAAAIHRRRGERPAAEAALQRAIRADPSRAAPREELARLYEEDGRREDAAAAWRGAAEAGSTEALFELARSAEAGRRPGEALELYRRYRSEAPTGRYAGRAASAIARLEAARTRWRMAAVGLAFALALSGGIVFYRLRSGQTLEQWLADHPARVHRIRAVVGRLRHEALKHGALLLPDAARRLAEGDEEARRDAAQHIAARLYGEEGGKSGTRGLVAEARAAVAELSAIARQDGARLNLSRRDPAFVHLARGLDALDRARPGLERLVAGAGLDRLASRTAKLLEEGARRFGLASGAGLERMLDRASALPVRLEALQELLARVAVEEHLPAPRLEPLGAFAAGERLPGVRLAPLDWETLWRNLFANALAAGRGRVPSPVRLGLSAEARRDGATGEARLVFILADDLPGVLSAEELRNRPAERGWGVIAEILRKNDGAFEVTPPPARGFTKGIGLDLPAVEVAS